MVSAGAADVAGLFRAVEQSAPAGLRRHSQLGFTGSDRRYAMLQAPIS